MFICTIEQGEYAGELSSIGLIAEFVYVDPTDPDPPVVATQFLYAIYNRPRLILTSTDGITWEPQASGTDATLRAVMRGSTGLVAVGSAGTVLTSPDGATWTAHPQTTQTDVIYSSSSTK